MQQSDYGWMFEKLSRCLKLVMKGLGSRLLNSFHARNRRFGQLVDSYRVAPFSTMLRVFTARVEV
jgi:hypothetical protein